jgi:hypothetical protein
MHGPSWLSSPNRQKNTSGPFGNPRTQGSRAGPFPDPRLFLGVPTPHLCTRGAASLGGRWSELRRAAPPTECRHVRPSDSLPPRHHLHSRPPTSSCRHLRVLSDDQVLLPLHILRALSLPSVSPFLSRSAAAILIYNEKTLFLLGQRT